MSALRMPLLKPAHRIALKTVKNGLFQLSTILPMAMPFGSSRIFAIIAPDKGSLRLGMIVPGLFFSTYCLANP
jgi:hypothetical protein